MKRAALRIVRLPGALDENLEEGILYVSEKYRTASHLCCCGCGRKVVTPLKSGFWSLSADGTLTPSVGNFGLPCKSHYSIRRGRVVWH